MTDLGLPDKFALFFHLLADHCQHALTTKLTEKALVAKHNILLRSASAANHNH